MRRPFTLSNSPLGNPDRRVTGEGELQMKKYVCEQCGKKKSDYYAPKCSFDRHQMTRFR